MRDRRFIKCLQLVVLAETTIQRKVKDWVDETTD